MLPGNLIIQNCFHNTKGPNDRFLLPLASQNQSYPKSKVHLWADFPLNQKKRDGGQSSPKEGMESLPSLFLPKSNLVITTQGRSGEEKVTNCSSPSSSTGNLLPTSSSPSSSHPQSAPAPPWKGWQIGQIWSLTTTAMSSASGLSLVIL